MSKARLVITAVVVEGRSQSEVARAYGVSQGWVSRLVARYRAEGETAFAPRSRRPATSPRSLPVEAVERILALRQDLSGQGLDAGPETIRWHLAREGVTVSAATIARYLARHGVVEPAPKKRPRSSYIRFEAAMPNETWQSDFTHYRLDDGSELGSELGTDVEILTWLDDCSRYALSVTAHRPVTGPVVITTFRNTAATHGFPASTLTDNGRVFTVRLFGGTPGRNHLEHELGERNITQKNGKPNHPQTQGKIERFQQTLKKWLRAQPNQPSTLAELQVLLDQFVELYNHHRPHKPLPHRATPATVYNSLPKAAPSTDRSADTHDRVRHDKIDHDKIDKAGGVTLRIAGQLRHIGIGRTHARTHVLLLIHDLDIRVVHATTGELLRELTLNPDRDYQPTGRSRARTKKQPEPP